MAKTGQPYKPNGDVVDLAYLAFVAGEVIDLNTGEADWLGLDYAEDRLRHLAAVCKRIGYKPELTHYCEDWCGLASPNEEGRELVVDWYWNGETIGC